MADRSVVISIRADVAGYVRDLKIAAAETQAFGRSTDRLGSPLGQMEQRSQSAGKEIDKLSGRLGVLADAAVTLGPALIPLGAATIPVLTGALAGLGAAAGGIGVAVLAMHGLGDAIKALDTYKLEPTAQNLEKLRIEQEKLGPAAAEFSRYIVSLEPTLRSLQQTAGAKFLPGLQDGIDSLLTRAPEIDKIVNRLSAGLGDITREAGASLAGSDFDAFFKYLETDARPTLEQFAQAAGNVGLGIANMITAFAPLSRDFTSGLVDATAAFANWSKGLDDNQSFQSFIDYVRTSGPEAIDFLGAIAQAIVGLLRAAAPMGQVVLPALTALAKAFAAIAGSPIGPGLYAAAAGLIAFNRAAKITEATSTKLTTTFEGLSRGRLAAGAVGGLALLATSLTDVDDKAGLANTTLGASAGLMAGGPWGLAIGTAVGQVLDFKDAYDQASASITAADDALRNTDASALLKERADLTAQLNKEHPKDGTLSNYMDAVVGSFHDFTGQSQDFKDRVSEIDGALKQGGDIADLFGATIGRTGDQMRVAAGDATALSGALAALNGWFDKRDAVRAYKDSIDTLTKSVKNGFTREDAANVDSIGRSILQVAQNIKSPKVRSDFLESARAQLVDMAEHSGPKAAAAIQEIINKFDDKGLTHPKITPQVDDSRAQSDVDGLQHKVKHSFDIMNGLAAKPTVDANDDPFRQTYGSVKQAMAQADRLRASPRVNVDPGNSIGILDQVAHLLGSLHDRTITVRTNHIGGVTSSAGGHSVDGSANGGTVPKTGLGYADRHPYMLADGEEVISNRHGQADRHRSLLKAINAGRMADGGTAGGRGDGNPMFLSQYGTDVISGSHSVAQALARLKAALDKSEKSLQKERTARDNAQQARDQFVSSVGGAYSSMDPFAASSSSPWSGQNPLGQFDSALASNTANTTAAQTALGTAASHGLDGPLYQALAQSGNLQLVQAFAGLSADQIQQREDAFGAQSNAQNALGASAAATAGFTAQLAAANDRLDKVVTEVKGLRHDVREADTNNQKSHKQNAKDVTAGVNGAAANGHRRGR